MKGFIYKITNRVNNKVYIGQTRFTLEHRWKQHIYESKRDTTKPLYRAFAKYGIENFSIESIEEVEYDNLNAREIFWIAELDSFNKGYNASLGGQGHIEFYNDSVFSEIRDLYLCGFSCTKIGDMFGISEKTVHNLLKAMGVKVKEKRRNYLKLNAYETKEVIQAFKDGKNMTEIGKKYGVCKTTVKKFLIANGVSDTDRYNLMKDVDAHPKVIDDFLSGMRYTDLETKYHSDARTLKRILVMNGINLNAYRGLRQTVKGAFCISDEQCLEAIKMYNDGKLVKDIARKFGINSSTVYELLKRYHVKSNRYNQSKSVQSLSAEAQG